MRYVVQVGDMKIGGEGDILVTYGLGSCLGLMVYDPLLQIGGMLNAMLPLSKINPSKADSNPFMFVDTGVPKMFKKIFEMGGEKKRLIVKAAGCGAPIGKNEIFKIGERNFTLLKKLLQKNTIILESEDVGGTNSRTVHFELSTGRIEISSNRLTWDL